MNLSEQDTYPRVDDTRLIPLSHGMFAKVDAEDFGKLTVWKWQARRDKYTGKFYAARSHCECGKNHSMLMHRFILGLSVGDGKLVDHRNMDTLDNRRENLRIATRSQNGANQLAHCNNTSGFKGVVFEKNSGLYRVRIRVDGRRIHLGRFSSFSSACDSYKEAAMRWHGQFARTDAE